MAGAVSIVVGQPFDTSPPLSPLSSLNPKLNSLTLKTPNQQGAYSDFPHFCLLLLFLIRSNTWQPRQPLKS